MGNLTAKTSGEIASFMTPAETNIKSLKVHFSPKQLGTGDPSPENVREIVGWDGVEVNGSGRNLFQNADGSLSYLYLKKGTTITISQSMDANVGYFRGYDINKTTNTPLVWINQKNNGKRIWSEYTLEDDIYYAVCYTGTGMKEAQITIDGSVDFEPYQGNIISYQWKLPDEYQEVEYVESTGTQYIELPFGFDSTDEIETRFTVLKGDVQYVSDKYIVSPSTWNDNNNRFAMGIHSSGGAGNNQYCVGFGQRSTANTFFQPRTVSDFLMHTWTYKDDVFRIDELGLSKDVSSIIFGGTTYPLRLFYGYNSNTMGKIAYYKHKKINGDIYDLIPCYRKSDGEIGMYDIANNVFYTNQGTGTFLKGEDVNKTFYGGYVDLISGELVETNVRDLLDAVNKEALSTEYNTSQTVFFRCDTDYTFETKKGTVTGISDFCCESLKPVSSNWGNGDSQDSKVNTITQRYNSTKAVCMRMYNSVFDINADDTVEVKKQKINTWLANNPIVISYKLAEPITHQLTPTQLSSFIGQNNFWSNADYVEIEYELKETEDIQKARKKIILNQPHIESINGDIANFTTNMKAPLKECKVYFEPVQEGSGEPSLDNVRNITGWDGISIGLPSEYQEVEYIESTGTQYIKTNYIPQKFDSIKCLFSMSEFYTSKSTFWTLFSAGTGTYQLIVLLSNDAVNGAYYKYFATGSASRFNFYPNINIKYEINIDSNGIISCNNRTAQSYYQGAVDTPLYLMKRANNMSPFKGKIYNFIISNNEINVLHLIPCYRKSDGEIGMYDTVSKTFYTNSGTGTFLKGDDVNTIIGNVSWSDEVGTVYGGYVDLVKGELVAKWYGFIADGINIKTNSSKYIKQEQDCFGAGIVYNSPQGITSDSYNQPTNILCNKIPVVTNKVVNIPYVYTPTAGKLYMVFYVGKISEHPEITSNEDVRAFVNNWLQENPLQLVYQLKTPIHYQLTPQQLLTFKGENNIWSDTNGQTEVKFWTH